MPTPRTRGEDDMLPPSHFDEYASTPRGATQFAVEAANIVSDPTTTYQPVLAKDLIDEYSRRNPLMKIARRFATVKHGSIASFEAGMKWTPNSDEIQAFLRSAKALPDYHLLKQAVGVNKEVERSGSAEDAIIMEMKNLSYSNSFPFGLMAKVSGIRGNLYVGKQRGVCYLPPNSYHQTPEEMAQIVHAIDPRTDIHEAFILDAIDEKTLRDEVLDVPGRPEIKVIKAGADAHIARILASSKNAASLMRRVKFDAKEHVIESLNRVGELMTVDSEAVDVCIDGFKKTKDDHEDFIPRTNFNELCVEFVPVSSKDNVGWSNIREHEVFEGMTSEQKDAALADGMRHCHMESLIDYLFKDEMLRNKLFGNNQ